MMGKLIITSGKIEKRKFHHYKNLILLEDVGIDKMQVSKIVSSGEKVINILLITKMLMTVKLNHFAKCFQKRLLM